MIVGQTMMTGTMIPCTTTLETIMSHTTRITVSLNHPPASAASARSAAGAQALGVLHQDAQIEDSADAN